MGSSIDGCCEEIMLWHDYSPNKFYSQRNNEVDVGLALQVRLQKL